MTDRALLQQALEALEKHAMQRTYAGGVYIANAAIALRERLAQPEFPTHEEGDDGWSDWVCPDPKSYLMKCCDCGLVHEAQFGVVHYASETEREDCDMVDDPNLQAVFRMRRSEQWTPKDTAYRPGGLAQPVQGHHQYPLQSDRMRIDPVTGDVSIGYAPPQRKPLTDEEKDAARWRFLVDNSFDKEGVTQFHVWEHSWEPHSQTGEPTEWKQRVRGPALDRFIDRAIEAAHGIKGEA